MSAKGAPASPPTRPDAAQLRAADPARSVWVAASAGSGKTKVLTDRVLRLLLDGCPPARILCLTFTRAAAAEMAVRLNDCLGRWTVIGDKALDAELAALIDAPPDDAMRVRARRLFAAVLDAPGGLKIMTIHAFCQSLLARFPVEAGIAPHFRLIEDRGAAELLATAEETVLARARADDSPLAGALETLAACVNQAQFRDLMKELRRQHRRLRAALGDGETGLDRLLARNRAVLGIAADETDETVVAAACAEDAFDRAGLKRAVARLREGSATNVALAEAIADWLSADRAERAARFDDYLQLFLTKDGAPRSERSLMNKAGREEDPAAFAALLAEQARLARASDRRKAVAVAEASAALLRLGAAILAEYAREKAARARLDYDDLILIAGRLLADPGVAPWVLFKLDGGLDHILVDEAQDTSPAQWRVIAAIADEFFAGAGAREARRTLFIVGDEKQSIFSFQGADLEALGRVRAHFAAKAAAAADGLREEPLTRSFRSTRAVLDAVDATFARPEARGGVVFDDRPIRHTTARKGQAGRVELWPLAEGEERPERAPWTPPTARQRAAAAIERLAEAIAATIRDWLDRGERLEARGRAIRPGDIMILVRWRSSLVGALNRALKRHGVAIAGADRLLLTTQMAVMDLIALGNVALMPDDDLTLACVLKGPFVGFDEEALFDLAYGREASLWRTLERRRGERSDFARAYETISGFMARADFAPPFELFSRVLGADGGRRRLVARLGADANDAIDEFLALALDYEREEAPSLQGFLHWLVAGETEIKRDLERAQGAVRILTVHGAKGLEAPIVFLPDTTSLPSGRGDPLLWAEEDDGAPPAILWPARKDREDPVCRALSAARRARAMAEYRRLLYVAMTRAEDRLYICGARPSRGEVPDEAWYSLVEAGLSGVAEPFEIDGPARAAGLAGRGLRIAQTQTAKPKAEGDEAKAATAETPLPAFARAPAPPEPAPPRPLAPSAAAGEPPALSPLEGGADERRFRRGRLIHRLLQVLPDYAPEDRARACRRFLARPGLGLDPETQAAIAAETLAVLDDSRFAALFGPGSRAEAPLVGVVGRRVVAGQVDRLVVSNDEILVVDFKTNRPAPERAADVPDAYLDQMAAYRAVLERIYPDRPVRCALLWTDGPRLMALDDDLLARRAPS